MSAPPKPIPLEEAQARLLEAVSPLGSENLAVNDSLGRYLAVPLDARRTQPAADLSAMDGYAVRDEDREGPWTVVGESAAGHPFAGTLGPGEAIRISTGAMMPDGGGAVLLQENAIREGKDLRLSGVDGPTPSHVRRRGFDFASGDRLLDAGLAMTPARIALALMGGHGSLSAGRLPALAVIDGGDELASDPAQVATHQIPASNGPMLAAMARGLCRSVTRIGPVPDRLEALVEAFDSAGEAEVIVTSGGASVGDHDLVLPALERWGATIDFWRIAMKPGKPVMVARRGSTVILGLPGNPVSSFVTAHLLLLPLLRRLAGAADALPHRVELPSAADLPPTGGRAEFVRARFAGDSVAPVSQQDSSALFALSATDALIYRPAHSGQVVAGERVTVFPLG